MARFLPCSSGVSHVQCHSPFKDAQALDLCMPTEARRIFPYENKRFAVLQELAVVATSILISFMALKRFKPHEQYLSIFTSPYKPLQKIRRIYIST
jgi:hypothetical protein